MYHAYFGLEKDPFSMTPDPGFLFLTVKHREALAALLFAVTRRKGFLVLTGDAGTGKTTLLSRLLRSMPSDKVQFSFVLNPTLTAAEFLEMALMDFGIENVPGSKAQRLMQFQQFLLHAHRAGKTSVLIVDEAHKLTTELLEEIRLLTNFETAEQKLLQIVLAGQPELTNLLNRNELRQLKQRIAVRVTVEPLAPQDVEPYMRSRWLRAGATARLPFTAEAVKMIAQYSRGIPRVINAVCDNALMNAFGADIRLLESRHILEVVGDLQLTTSGDCKAGLHDLLTESAVDAAAPKASTEPQAPAKKIIPPEVQPPVEDYLSGSFKTLARYMPRRSEGQPPVEEYPADSFKTLQRYMPATPQAPRLLVKLHLAKG